MKKITSFLLIFAFIAGAVLAFPAEAEAAVKKNGYYQFTNGLPPCVTCSITDNYITVQQNSNTKYTYGKKNFNYKSAGKRIKKSYKFKLAKKIYYYTSEDPVHPVKKYGTTLYVRKGKKIKRSTLVKNRKEYSQYICMSVIVKKGKVVAIGSSM